MAQVIFMSKPYDGSSYEIGDTVTVKASIDPSTLSSGYSSYTVRFYINGSRTSKVSVTSGWTASMKYTFDDSDYGTVEIYAVLCNSSGSELGPKSDTVSITIDAPLVGVIYYARVVLYGNGGTYNGYSSWTYEDSQTEWASSATISVAYSDPGFTRQGYTLVGFSKSSTATTASYDTSGTIKVTSTSDDPDNPTTVKLYAVWSKSNLRPKDWDWYEDGNSYVAKGSALSLTAAGWNDFISRIQEFAIYKNITLSSTYLNNAYATKGTTMLASQANAVRYLINQLSPPTSVPSTVSSGTTITAYFVNRLATSLNSIK